jgi:L-ribulose-5-phosphate 4-epimerase
MFAKDLREAVYEANINIVKHNLVIFTWGNASATDRNAGIMVIKPSGVDYDNLKAEDMVLLELSTGNIIESKLRPSSDTPTHLLLYQTYAEIGGVVHTHSREATAWAQAGRDLPCFGTTHADYFYGTIPCTKPMTHQEIYSGKGYEHTTGEVMIREFSERNLNPLQVPAVLVHGHAPFAWGKDVHKAVHNAVVLEEAAGIARKTLAMNPDAKGISQDLLDKHYLRKHGAKAYYGQK